MDYKALSSVALPNLRSRRGRVALSMVCIRSTLQAVVFWVQSH